MEEILEATKDAIMEAILEQKKDTIMEENLGVNLEAKPKAIFNAIPEAKQEAWLGEKIEVEKEAKLGATILGAKSNAIVGDISDAIVGSKYRTNSSAQLNTPFGIGFYTDHWSQFMYSKTLNFDTILGANGLFCCCVFK